MMGVSLQDTLLLIAVVLVGDPLRTLKGTLEGTLIGTYDPFPKASNNPK